MHRILIDHARARSADKRGGDRDRVTLSAVEGWNPEARYVDVIEFEAALSSLERPDPRAGRVVDRRHFGGLMEEEIGRGSYLSVRRVCGPVKPPAIPA
jgi:hypothetical protein